MKRLLLLPAIVAFSAGTAYAQDMERHVTVNLQNIEPDIAANVTVDSTSGIPSTVNVPPWLAENVCGIDSAELAAQLQRGSANCMAVANSPELMRIVEEVIVAGYTSNDPRGTGTDETVTGGIDDDDSNGNGDPGTDDGSGDDTGNGDDTDGTDDGAMD